MIFFVAIETQQEENQKNCSNNQDIYKETNIVHTLIKSSMKRCSVKFGKEMINHEKQ